MLSIIDIIMNILCLIALIWPPIYYWKVVPRTTDLWEPVKRPALVAGLWAAAVAVQFLALAIVNGIIKDLFV